MTNNDLAYVACRQSVDGEAMKIRTGWAGETLPSSLDVLSEVLATPGLSEDRHQYLDKEIAPFVSAAAQSTFCPGGESLDVTLLNISILTAKFYIKMNALLKLLNKLEYSALLS